MILAGKKLAALKRTISTLPFFYPKFNKPGNPRNPEKNH
jgi:hypothetical protein